MCVCVCVFNVVQYVSLLWLLGCMSHLSLCIPQDYEKYSLMFCFSTLLNYLDFNPNSCGIYYILRNEIDIQLYIFLNG